MKSLILISIVVISVSGDQKDFRMIDSIYQEKECSTKGGMCVVGADCPSGRLAERGLCPQQQRSKHVECCYGVSEKETRCQRRGGDCLEGIGPCNPTLIISKATDCPKDTTCCTLVR